MSALETQDRKTGGLAASYIPRDLAQIAEEEGLHPPKFPKRAAAPKDAGGQAPPELKAAAADALAKFRATEEYAALMADLPGMNLYQLQHRLEAVLNGPHFAPLLEMMRQPESFSVDLSDMVPKAVSLGLLAEAVVFVGLSGSVGYVMNIHADGSGIYAGGAFDAGIDAGFEGDVCIGFWREQVDDLSGVYVGEEVDVDDVIGVTEATFLHDDELALAFIGFDLGIEDGMENTDFYFTEFGLGRAPIYQPGDAAYLVQLRTLTCENSKDNYDTVYFEFLADDDSTEYRYPAWDGYVMCEEHRDEKFYQWGVGLIVKFNSKLILRMHVGDHTMNDWNIYPSTIGSAGSTSTIQWDEKVSGMNEINYTMSLKVLKAG